MARIERKHSTKHEVPSHEPFWEAECILEEKIVGSKKWYRIKWRGSDPETGLQYDPTWEPESSPNELLLATWRDQKAQLEIAGASKGAIVRVENQHPESYPSLSAPEDPCAPVAGTSGSAVQIVANHQPRTSDQVQMARMEEAHKQNRAVWVAEKARYSSKVQGLTKDNNILRKRLATREAAHKRTVKVVIVLHELYAYAIGMGIVKYVTCNKNKLQALSWILRTYEEAKKKGFVKSGVTLGARVDANYIRAAIEAIASIKNHRRGK